MPDETKQCEQLAEGGDNTTPIGEPSTPVVPAEQEEGLDQDEL
jgi:hypothetical protein